MEKIDCLIIGHYDIQIKDLISFLSDDTSLKVMNYGFINYENKYLTFADFFNIIYSESNQITNGKGIRMSDLLTSTISVLASYLNKNDISFKYILNVNEQRDTLENYLSNYEFTTVVITTTLYVIPFPISELVEYIKSFNKKLKIIVGGPYIDTSYRTKSQEEFNFLLSEIIKADIYIISMQGERTLVKLIKAINNNTSPEIENTCINQNGIIKWNELIAENNELSENLINWELFPAYEFINYRSALSCAFNCGFCGFPMRAGKYKTLDVESIELQLNEMVRYNKNLKSVYFIDDTFNIPPERFKKILEVIIKNQYSFKWHSYFRCQYANEELVRLMKESGCEGVFLGIESGNDSILKNMNKKTTVSEYLKGIELLKKYDIPTFGSFIIGFPGETISTVKDTVNFIENSGLDFFINQIWYCDPLTPVWDDKEKYGLKGEGYNWSHKTMNAKVASMFFDKIFLDVKNCIFVPQYNFDWLMFFRIKALGYSIDQIKSIFISYNDILKEKMLNSNNNEPSYHLIENFRENCKLPLKVM